MVAVVLASKLRYVMQSVLKEKVADSAISF